MKHFFLYLTALITLVLTGCTMNPTSSPVVETDSSMSVSAEHCQMMPNMPGCEMYNTGGNNNHVSGHMNHAAMVTDAASFLFEMIPHHQEAVDSSQQLMMVTQNTELKNLLQNIIRGQTSEIIMMKRWLSDYYSGSNYVPQYMKMMRDTTTINDVTTLEKMYIEDMIPHHQGAVDMANALLQIFAQQNPMIKLTTEGATHREELKQFAQNIIGSQTIEIQQLKMLLQTVR